jgi:hypothetical protein
MQIIAYIADIIRTDLSVGRLNRRNYDYHSFKFHKKHSFTVLFQLFNFDPHL